MLRILACVTKIFCRRRYSRALVETRRLLDEKVVRRFMVSLRRKNPVIRHLLRRVLYNIGKYLVWNLRLSSCSSDTTLIQVYYNLCTYLELCYLQKMAVHPNPITMLRGHCVKIATNFVSSKLLKYKAAQSQTRLMYTVT